MLKTLTLALVLAAFGISAANAQQLAAVESKGKHGQVKLDKVVTGYLSDLNGRFRLRVTEVTYDPSGYIGPHYQFGSSIRCYGMPNLPAHVFLARLHTRSTASSATAIASISSSASGE